MTLRILDLAEDADLCQVAGAEQLSVDGRFVAQLSSAVLNQSSLAEWRRTLREFAAQSATEAEAITRAIGEFLTRSPRSGR